MAKDKKGERRVGAGEGPHTVKELLAEIKDSSELMVDLAYAAVFFSDESLASEVTQLEDRMSVYLQQLRKLAILAARSPEDAEHMAGVLEIASAVEKIADAAEDIARVVSSGLGIVDDLRKDLRHADEIVSRIKVRTGAPTIGQSLRELMMPVEIGMWILAARRGGDWNLDPGPNYVVAEGDVLLVKGPEDGVELARNLMGAPSLPDPPDAPEIVLSDLDRAVDLLVEMKNSAEVAVGLAYSALLFNDRALAAEVSNLEARSDAVHDELESWVLRSAQEARNPDELRGLIRLAGASEMIFDSARGMTRLVEAGEELHPVIAAALVESDEVGYEGIVQSSSAADTRSIKELMIETETGMFVLAVQRGRRWTYRPKPGFRLQGGDRIIAIGPPEGGEELDGILGMQRELAET
ncbi:MAG TPA: TrkA C-terminal domain-containing protein [Actinomycetota bacterium]|nr:TrkA C-terminal domain-containing protein [Actinomycetota bacterium]